MKNSKAAEILFAQAKDLIGCALNALREYNTIADALTEMGYAEPSDGWGEPWPVPMLELTTGHMMYYDAEFLEGFRSRGPIRKPKSELISGRRFAVAVERNRIGTEVGWKCLYCGDPGDESKGPDGRGWHVDHAYPIIRGGDDGSDNLVLACATCNLDKKAKTAAEYFEARRLAAEKIA